MEEVAHELGSQGLLWVELVHSEMEKNIPGRENDTEARECWPGGLARQGFCRGVWKPEAAPWAPEGDPDWRRCCLSEPLEDLGGGWRE